MATVIVGAKIGQRHERTGIAVVEAERRGADLHYIARHLERLPAGTPYPDAGARLFEVAKGAARYAGRVVTSQITSYMTGATLHQCTRQDLTVYVDVTGLGDPILSLVTAAGIKKANPVYFNSGDRRLAEKEHGIEKVTLGKGWLVARLQVLLQTGRLHLPDTAEAGALAKDLREYEIRMEPDANERYGAFSVSERDDLITALGLAVQGGG